MINDTTLKQYSPKKYSNLVLRVTMMVDDFVGHFYKKIPIGANRRYVLSLNYFLEHISFFDSDCNLEYHEYDNLDEAMKKERIASYGHSGYYTVELYKSKNEILRLRDDEWCFGDNVVSIQIIGYEDEEEKDDE